MSLRHTPRQAERDVRLHEPHAVHPHPPHPLAPPPPSLLNGNGVVPGTPSIANGAAHHISPKIASGAAPTNGAVPPSIQKLNDANEQTWLVIGSVAEQMGDLEHALSAYENALRHNPMSIAGLTQVAGIARIKENYPLAVEYFQRVLSLQQDNGEIWSALGHCYLMQDDLQKAYSAYQHALYSLPNPKENPKLWYGIGILYDRYGSLDNAEEAFSSVLKMDKDFDKSNEVLFRLGIIYKQQTKYDESLRCFDRILRNPPSPLANADIWFQIGHVYEQQGDHLRAREAYERVVSENPVHAKVLQQLGWLYHQDGPSFQDQDLAIQYLTKSLEADPSDAQSWYLLGRAYMAGQKYNKAYEAYQQAVYRDGRNPTFWCSIGVLYFQINQFRDALDAYSRAIRINPYIPEVWFDLGSLYESCNNQISDAIDAYARAAELDPGNGAITQRLQLLKHSQATGAQLPAAPAPQDVHPTAYASAVVAPPGLGPPLMMHPTANGRPVFRADSRGPPEPSLPLPPPSQGGPARSSPAPFRGGPPPPVILDESRHGVSHTPLAPMDVDHIPPHARESNVYPPPRESVPGRNMNLLLHHSTPQGREPEPVRAAPPHAHDPFYPRNSRAPSIPASPPPHAARPRSPGASPYQTFHPGRATVGPAQSHPHPQSPRYSREASAAAAAEREQAWERRERERERERLGWGRPSGEFSSHPPPQPSYYASRGPSPPPPAHRAHSPPRVARDQSPPRTSPMAAHVQSAPRGYWDIHGGPSAPPMQPPSPRVRPEPMQVDRDVSLDRRAPPRGYVESPEASRPAGHGAPPPPPPPFAGGSMCGSESPHMSQRGAPGAEQKRRRGAKDKEEPAGPGLPGPEPPKKERKRRTQTKRPKDDRGRTETPKPYLQDRLPPQQPPPFKVAYPAKPNESPEPVSSNGSGSQNRSVQPSPTSATALPPARVVDEDYDEGVAETLIGLSTYRAAPDQIVQYSGSTSGPALPPPQRLTQPSPSPSLASHRGSISSTRSRNSPPHSSGGLVNAMKRPLSPVPDESENKRSKMEAPKRRASSPMPSSRPSPIPFRTQPPSHSHSPETRQMDKPKHPSYPSSPQLPAVLPPVPRPVGAGLSHNSASVALPPIATLSPTSTAPSPARETERMSTENGQSRSNSPIAPTTSRGKLSEVMNHPTGSPTAKMTSGPAAPPPPGEKPEHAS